MLYPAGVGGAVHLDQPVIHRGQRGVHEMRHAPKYNVGSSSKKGAAPGLCGSGHSSHGLPVPTRTRVLDGSTSDGDSARCCLSAATACSVTTEVDGTDTESRPVAATPGGAADILACLISYSSGRGGGVTSHYATSTACVEGMASPVRIVRPAADTTSWAIGGSNCTASTADVAIADGCPTCAAEGVTVAVRDAWPEGTRAALASLPPDLGSATAAPLVAQRPSLLPTPRSPPQADAAKAQQLARVYVRTRQ